MIPEGFEPDKILVFEVKEGPGAIHVENIGFILPDINKPKTHSVIYTYIGEPIEVIGEAGEMINLWLEAVGQENE